MKAVKSTRNIKFKKVKKSVAILAFKGKLWAYRLKKVNFWGNDGKKTIPGTKKGHTTLGTKTKHEY